MHSKLPHTLRINEIAKINSSVLHERTEARAGAQKVVSICSLSTIFHVRLRISNKFKNNSIWLKSQQTLLQKLASRVTSRYFIGEAMRHIAVDESEAEKKGRQLKSLSRLKKGDIVFKSIPSACLLHLATWDSKCSSCFGTPVKLLKCSQCKIVKYCDVACQKADWSQNHGFECQRLKELFAFNKSSQALSDEMISDLLLVSRIIRQGNKQPQHLKEKVAPVDMVWFEEDRSHHRKKIAQCALQFSFVSKDTTINEIEEYLCRFPCNNFGITDDLFINIGAGVFPLAAMANHSCISNCVLRLKHQNVFISLPSHIVLLKSYEPKTHVLQARCIKDIEIGEEITHSYVDVGSSLESRQAIFSAEYHFKCDCSRCSSKSSDDWLHLNNPYSVPSFNWNCEPKFIVNKHLQVKVNDDALSLLKDWSYFLTENIYEGKFQVAAEYSLYISHLYTKMYNPFHPMIGLNLYTLGDLLLNCSQSISTTKEAKKEIEKTAILKLKEALQVLRVTHGKDNSLVDGLRSLLSSY